MSYSTTEREQDNIYVNVIINNFGTVTNPEGAIPAKYNVTKTQPILDDCSKYYASVIRFDIPLSSIPILIFPIVPASASVNPQPNPNLSPIIIGITDTLGVDHPVNLLYTPDNTISVPTQNTVNKQVITPYYFVYDYQNLINAFNEALHTAYVAAGSPGGAGNDPFLFYSIETQLINLVVTATFLATANVKIFINEFALTYLDGFQLKFLGVNQANGHDYDFVLKDPTISPNPNGYKIFGYPLNTFPAASTWYSFIQQYNQINSWFALRKIIFATNNIPVAKEYIPAYTSQGQQSSVAASFPIITDFIPQLEYSNQARSIAYYYPSSQYRLVDLLSTAPLFTIDLDIYWEDKLGNLYPLYLLLNQQINVKLAFLRKSLYKPMNALLYK